MRSGKRTEGEDGDDVVRYASGRRRRVRWRPTVVAMSLVVLGLFLLDMINEHVIWRDRQEYCVRCFCDSSVTTLDVFGLEFETKRNVRVNLASSTIERCDGAPCQHEWIDAGHLYAYSLSGRRREMGDSHAPDGWLVRNIADTPGALCDVVLDRLCGDFAFRDRLHRIAVSGDPCEINAVLEELLEAAEALEQQRSASQPISAADVGVDNCLDE